MVESLIEQQQAFAAHLRSPHRFPAPADVEDRRMAIYRDLVFRNISSFIAASFPVLRTLHDDDQWQTLIREFSDQHRCHTPLFPEIPREFLQYLQDERGERESDPPFMLELAHYEWVELALDLDTTDLEAISADPDGDLMDGVPVVSPLAWLLSYHYPVHEIRPEFQPTEPPEQPTHLLVYRNRDDRVRFMRLNAVSAHLVAALKEGPGHSGREALLAVAGALGHAESDTVLAAGERLLEDLRQRDVILGARPAD